MLGIAMSGERDSICWIFWTWWWAAQGKEFNSPVISVNSVGHAESTGSKNVYYLFFLFDGRSCNLAKRCFHYLNRRVLCDFTLSFQEAGVRGRGSRYYFQISCDRFDPIFFLFSVPSYSTVGRYLLSSVEEASLHARKMCIITEQEVHWTYFTVATNLAFIQRHFRCQTFVIRPFIAVGSF